MSTALTRNLLLLVVLFSESYFSFSQNDDFPIDKWIVKLAAKKDTYNNDFWKLTVTLRSMDSAKASAIMKELQEKGASSGRRFQIRYKIVEAQLKYVKFRPRDYTWQEYADIDTLLRQALFEAYEIDDLDLAELASRHLGELNYFSGKLELAAMYGVNAVELLDTTVGRKNPFESYTYWTLGEIMYHTGNYEKCIYYTLQAFRFGLDTIYPDKTGRMMGWNTIGMAYQQLQKHDSALQAYDQSLQIAKRNNNQVWIGIGEGNKAKIFFLQQKFDQAKPLLAFDYVVSKQNGIYDNAAYSLRWLALINLHEGKKDSALTKAKESLELFQKEKSKQPFLRDIYSTIAEVYESMGKTDSSYRYNQLYTYLRDSLERVLAVSEDRIVRIKLEHEQNVARIKGLQKERATEALKRNFLVVGIILVTALALLVLNRQRIKLRYNRELARREKAAAAAEINAAKEQLHAFTQNIIEKSALIEKLEQQLKSAAFNSDQQHLVDELTHQAILTETDWEKFKLLFEKIHPRFFLKLKDKVADITVAEQRMAALSRLHLTTREAASMLGISPNSVNKTKQRLRQRFNLPVDANIEEYIANLL